MSSDRGSRAGGEAKDLEGDQVAELELLRCLADWLSAPPVSAAAFAPLACRSWQAFKHEREHEAVLTLLSLSPYPSLAAALRAEHLLLHHPLTDCLQIKSHQCPRDCVIRVNHETDPRSGVSALTHMLMHIVCHRDSIAAPCSALR